jgi:hypothetical protein
MPITDIPYEELKPIYIPRDSKLNEDVIKNFDDMMAFATPAQYRDTLMEIYNMYILNEHKNLPPDFIDIASRMVVMMEFFKTCE